MKLSVFGVVLGSLVTLFTAVARGQAANGTESATGGSGGSRFYGIISMATNDMEQGVSTTNNSLAMQPDVGYQWTQAQLGFWGSNTQYPDNGESLNLRPHASYKFMPTAGIDFKVELGYSFFFKSTTRDTLYYMGDFNYNTHHFIFEQDQNWQGTGNPNLWIAWNHNIPAFWGFDYTWTVGYQMLSVSGYNSYFAALAGLEYKTPMIVTDLLLSYNAGATQFAGGIDNTTALVRFTVRF